MKTKLIATMLLAGSTMFAAPGIHVGVGLNFGVPAPAPVVVAPPVVAAVAPCPGPDYVWIGGYYDFVGGRRVWHDGYWQHHAFAPRYEAGRHFRR